MKIFGKTNTNCCTYHLIFTCNYEIFKNLFYTSIIIQIFIDAIDFFSDSQVHVPGLHHLIKFNSFLSLEIYYQEP